MYLLITPIYILIATMPLRRDMIRVSGNFTSILNDWMIHRGVQDQMLERQIDFLTAQPNVSGDAWREVLEDVRRLTGDEAVGLEIGALVRLHHVGILGYLTLNSDNLADALRTYIMCERHFYGVGFADLSSDDKSLTIAWPDKLGDANRLFVQVAFAVLITFMRHRFPGSAKLTQVSLTGSPPACTQPFERFFGCEVGFGTNRPSLSFDSAAVFNSAESELPADYEIMRQEQIHAVSHQFLVAEPLLRKLQIELLKRIPESRSSLEEVCSALYISPRTLQRRLGAFGFTFQQVLDGVREQLAIRYLRYSPLSLVEIAILLGFSNQSAFNRAFKHWMQMTPLEFRCLPQS
ncbi:MAG: AraC family transcriptional regulator ligand-binding domain-containing protein [Sphingorhabdus sp.]